MKKIILQFGLFSVLLAALLLLLKYSWISGAWQAELIITICSIALIAFGFALSKYLKKEKVNTSITTLESKLVAASLGISQREFEVLQLVADGLSNAQVADKLFVSENTIKTHMANLFVKLSVKRRTEAVKKAHEIGLLLSNE